MSEGQTNAEIISASRSGGMLQIGIDMKSVASTTWRILTATISPQ